jgi:hypothetical protein
MAYPTQLLPPTVRTAINKRRKYTSPTGLILAQERRQIMAKACQDTAFSALFMTCRFNEITLK